ncbi:WxL protein peptidoglycan domain-containing protein [Fructilactobacillus carniphilus]|uniref:DUF916 and DUF3324 domain-containing protein n=1 Tax=Fructilactobacillus carniphilus TaxID=2940297 RepID=A0ABY5BZ38_9LACO|nr:DUF916 domain-containing protein [Fructilactobacillus carniphilus]USS90361.1 DUF916 and DUF3324 domain-containing protein [Fructilactobacillus carniphilus]
MRTKTWFTLALVCITTIVTVSLPSFSHAQSVPSDFSVTPQLGGLPLQKGAGYFALRSKDHTTYKLPLLVTNDSNQQLHVTTRLNNAVTSPNGTINYQDSSAQPRGKQSLTNKVIGKRTKHVTVAPHSNQVVTYQINSGNQGRGITLGGITATAPVGQTNHVQNDVTFVTGVSLNAQKNQPNLQQLRLTKVEVAPLATSATVVARISNNHPQLLQHLRGKITLEQGSKIISSKRLTNVNIAPNSRVKFDLPPKKVATGNYQVVVKLQGHGQNLNVHRNISIKQALN